MTFCTLKQYLTILVKALCTLLLHHTESIKIENDTDKIIAAPRLIILQWQTFVTYHHRLHVNA